MFASRITRVATGVVITLLMLSTLNVACIDFDIDADLSLDGPIQLEGDVGVSLGDGLDGSSVIDPIPGLGCCEGQNGCGCSYTIGMDCNDCALLCCL